MKLWKRNILSMLVCFSIAFYLLFNKYNGDIDKMLELAAIISNICVMLLLIPILIDNYINNR